MTASAVTESPFQLFIEAAHRHATEWLSVRKSLQTEAGASHSVMYVTIQWDDGGARTLADLARNIKGSLVIITLV